MGSHVNGAHRPSRVGLLNLAEGDGARAVRFILDDLAEAGAFYELHSGVTSPVEFALGEADERDASVLGEAGGCDASVPGDASSCDAFVLGFYLHDADEFAPIGQAADSVYRNLPRGAMVYGLCCSESFAADPAPRALEQLEAACAESGLVWCGGMAVRCAGVLPRLQGKPRMGMARRKVSEATDELLLAIRCDLRAGTILSRPGLPWCLREAMRLA